MSPTSAAPCNNTPRPHTLATNRTSPEAHTRIHTLSPSSSRRYACDSHSACPAIQAVSAAARRAHESEGNARRGTSGSGQRKYCRQLHSFPLPKQGSTHLRRADLVEHDKQGCLEEHGALDAQARGERDAGAEDERDLREEGRKWVPQRADEGRRAGRGKRACKVDREEIGRKVVPVVQAREMVQEGVFEERMAPAAY